MVGEDLGGGNEGWTNKGKGSPILYWGGRIFLKGLGEGGCKTLPKANARGVIAGETGQVGKMYPRGGGGGFMKGARLFKTAANR